MARAVTRIRAERCALRAVGSPRRALKWAASRTGLSPAAGVRRRGRTREHSNARAHSRMRTVRRTATSEHSVCRALTRVCGARREALIPARCTTGAWLSVGLPCYHVAGAKQSRCTKKNRHSESVCTIYEVDGF